MSADVLPGRVMVVDDNPGLLDNLIEILEAAGHTAVGAKTRSAALAVAQGGFDLALLDLKLPDGNGAELALELRKQNPNAAVVLLTGFASVETAAAAVRAGAFAFLVKPCATPELLFTVEQALKHVRLQAEKGVLARRAQVAEKLAAVGTMTAGLSHEIRNPLNAAGLQLSVLQRRIEKLPAELQASLLEPLTLVREEIRRLDHILEDFLQFARPRELFARPVDLNASMGRVADLLEGDAERRGVQMARNFQSIPTVQGDEGRLRQVMMNLMLNALEATPRGGKVRVSTWAADGEVMLAVEDSGRGVSLEARAHLFEPFFTTKPQGSGLGLPIVHAIVTQHGGSIHVEQPEAGGARFVVRLPRLG